MGLTNTDVWSIAISGSNIFIGTNGGGVFLSTNNGTSWTAFNNILSYTWVRSLEIYGSDIFAGTNNGGVFLSTNNGTSWTAVNTSLPYKIRALAINGNNIFAGTYGSGVWYRPLSEMLGMKENISNTHFILYPNPTSNKITITEIDNYSKETTVSIFNINGQQSKSVKFTGQDSFDLDFSTLAKGIYLLKIQTDNIIVNRNLIIR